MKRPRSYEEDLEDDWGGRRDLPSSSSSSHRRFYDDRRRRFDHESERFDRQRSFDHHRHHRDDRLYRSESFSGAFARREVPKGFRSERERGDRSRREGSGGSWRRSSSERRDSAEEEAMRSPDSVERGSYRGRVRLRESPGGEERNSRRVEATVEEKVSKGESCSSSEMEEGELEPEAEAGGDSVEPSNELQLEGFKEKETGVSDGGNVAEVGIQNEEILLVENNLEVDGVDKNHKGADDANIVEDENNLYGNRKEILEDEGLSLPTDGMEPQGQAEEDQRVGTSASPLDALVAKSEEQRGEGEGIVADVGSPEKKEIAIDLKLQQNEARGFDLEVEPDSAVSSFSLSKEAVVDNNLHDITHKLMTDKANHKDKGKSIAVSLSSKTDSVDDEDATEGEGPSSIRAFDLLFPSDVIRSDKAKNVGIVIGKQKDEKLKLEPLDLSLGLPGNSAEQTTKHLNRNPASPSRARSIQSLPSSFRTNSDGFTTSISFSGSHTFAHNPSCSLTHNSTENYEQSVGSHPIFQGVDQVLNGTVWQAQTSNEPKRKVGAGSLFHRILMNGNPFHQALNGQHQLQPTDLSRQSSLPRQPSPSNSHGSRHTRSERSKDKRLLTRERSSSSLPTGEQLEGEKPVLNGVSLEMIVCKIVSEPLQAVGRMLKEMSEQFVAYLKETICEMIANADKHGQLQALQEGLYRRSDLTIETLTECPRALLEILVALKTGLPDFLQRTHNNVAANDLAEIYFNLKCRNLACRTLLPVDDCDCKICILKNGFCSACMCLVCSKFDMASNTCSWVGCDVCLHWCHTDCGLRDCRIRNGPSSSGQQGMTEMQFHCLACDHRSEMLGFVTEVFKTCAREWKSETLARELHYVRRIFSASNDVRGKELCIVANQMLQKLEVKANLSEVINYVMAFISESESSTNNSTSIISPKGPSRNNAEGSNGIACPSKEPTWVPSNSLGKVSPRDNTSILSRRNADQVDRQNRDAELPLNLVKKPVIDELESVVIFKQAESKMYQERADIAKREAESLKRIAGAKNVKVDEDYASRIARLRLSDAEERRRQKLEELKIIERANHQYFNMKMRMEAEIKDLLMKMEATKRHL